VSTYSRTFEYELLSSQLTNRRVTGRTSGYTTIKMQHRSNTLFLLFLVTLLLVTLFQANVYQVSLAQHELVGPLDVNKTFWPELVGVNGEVAEAKIIEATGLHVVVIPYGYMTTMEYRSDRVRIWLDASGNVSKPPSIT
jgi:hypothetical protein